MSENQHPNLPESRFPLCMPSTMTYKEHKYTRKDNPSHSIMKNQWTCYYRCSVYRKTSCTAKLTVISYDSDPSKPEIALTGGDHICDGHVNKKSRVGDVVDLTDEDGGIIDLRTEMKEVIEQKAIDERTKSGLVIARETLKQFMDEYKNRPTHMMEIEQMSSLVYRVRNKEFADWESAVNSFPLNSSGETDERLFLQFNNFINIDGKLEKIIGWAHPSLLHDLRHGANQFLMDNTYHETPNGFYQCFILMFFHRAANIYVPVYYVLTQSKHETTYQHVLNAIIASTGFTLTASAIICDFEKGLRNAVKDQFQSDGFKMIGCLFHWKQCLRRKMEELHFCFDSVTEAIGENGILNFLTVIPYDEIERGIEYCQRKLLAKFPHHSTKFQLFFAYFRKTWLRSYSPEDWNISAILNGHEDVLVNRTNNPLERFNRTLHTSFPHAHPSMIDFINSIREISIEYVDLLARISRGKQRPGEDPHPTIYSVPSDF